VNGDDVKVHAAGGVVWRMGAQGPEVLVIHRPAPYDDWTFPKGKRDPADPDDEHCALREVAEETGLRCVLGRELASVRYRDRRGRAKRVRYWEMTVVAGQFTPNAEVDEVRWLAPAAARATLTYPRDRDVLDAFEAFAGTGGDLPRASGA